MTERMLAHSRGYVIKGVLHPRWLISGYHKVFKGENTQVYMTSHEEIRLGRLHIIKRSLDKARDPDIEKLIAKCCMEWGTSRRTVLEYIKTVRVANG